MLASEGPECENPAFVALPRTLVSLASEVPLGALACDSLVWSFDLPCRAGSAAAPPRSLVVLASEGPECESPAFVALPRTLVSLASEVPVGALACDSLVSLSGLVCLFLFQIHIDADLEQKETHKPR